MLDTGLGVRCTSTDIHVISGRPVTDHGVVIGATYGLLTEAESLRLVRTLQENLDPGHVVPEIPWAAVARRRDGSVVATTATMLASGIFFSEETTQSGTELIIATDPGQVVRARTTTTDLNHDYIRRYAVMSTNDTDTPYSQVERRSGGTTLRWHPDRAGQRCKFHMWCGPAAWPDAHLEGPDTAQQYLEVFDETMAGLVDRLDVLATTLSGGLDSSFMVAGLARAAGTGDRITAFTHVPLAGALTESIGSWDPDDSHLAATVVAMYADKVTHQRVRNLDLRQPLDAAHERSQLSWVPVFNPSNQVWSDEIRDRARALGSEHVLYGTNGNAAFSFQHGYAAEYYLGKGHLHSLGRIALREQRNSSWHHSLRQNFLSPAVRRLFPVDDGLQEYARHFGLTRLLPDRNRNVSGRERYLRWLSGRADGMVAAMNPAARGNVIDPFRSRTLLDLAAAITPAQWQSTGEPRGFARLLSAGRVPDAVRLRQRRGGQAWDAWFWVRSHKQRYLDEVDQLAETAVLGELVDHDLIRRRIESWPWDEVHGPDHLDVVAIERVLSLGRFTRMTETRLGTLNAAQ